MNAFFCIRNAGRVTHPHAGSPGHGGLVSIHEGTWGKTSLAESPRVGLTHWPESL